MSILGSNIVKLFSQRSKYNRSCEYIDISTLLEEYLVESGLRQLDENAILTINFTEAGNILYKYSIVYSHQVDELCLMTYNAARSGDYPDTSDTIEIGGEKGKKREKMQVKWADFKHIDLEEAHNIVIRKNFDSKRIAMLPRAFIQFEPRVMSDNDIKLRDYKGDIFGLMNDFRVNWNTDENFMLCDDMDFSTRNNISDITNKVPNSTASLSNSSHVSDFSADFNSDSGINTDDQSVNSFAIDASVIPDTPTLDVVVTVIEKHAPNPKKRKLSFKTPVIKNIPSKFTLSTSLSGSLNMVDMPKCEFSLDFLNRVMIKRKRQRTSFENFINEICADGNMDDQFLMNEMSPKFKKKPRLTWSREEIHKKIKLSSENDISKGFYDDEVNITLFKNIEALGKVCDHLSLINIHDGDTLSDCRNINYADDDDFPDNTYIGNQRNMFEPSIARRLAEADSMPAHAEQSEMSKRVDNWLLSMQKKFKFSENQKKFDILTYRQNIMDSFATVDKKTINFSEVIMNQPQDEVARYFLTILMLASKEKVVIKQPPPLSCGDFEMSMESTDCRGIDDSMFV